MHMDPVSFYRLQITSAGSLDSIIYFVFAPAILSIILIIGWHMLTTEALINDTTTGFTLVVTFVNNLSLSYALRYEFFKRGHIM